MIMENSNFKHSEITGLIIRAFFNVYNSLGFGFLEKVYERSMMIELKNQGLKCESQKQIKVYYTGLEVGEYYADILVDDCVIVELKAAEIIIPEHEAQLINYLKSTEIEVGLLLNFGKTAQYQRKAFSNDRKKSFQS
jgi:GxxExxY protein